MDNVVETFKTLPAAAVSDALDRLGLEGACLGIRPLRFGWTMVGRAVTVKYRPCGLDKGTVGDYIDDVDPGAVVVLDNHGRLDCTVWGDILTTAAHRKGVAGTVIDGVCRDVNRSLALNYPIFSRGYYMRTGKDRVEVDGMDVPVEVSKILVHPGDVVLGNDDGVVVIPRARENEVLEVAQAIEDTERQIGEAVGQGQRLVDARQTFRYHQLQRHQR